MNYDNDWYLDILYPHIIDRKDIAQEFQTGMSSLLYSGFPDYNRLKSVMQPLIARMDAKLLSPVYFPNPPEKPSSKKPPEQCVGLGFDGKSASVDFGQNPVFSLSDTFTIGIWFRTDDAAPAGKYLLRAGWPRQGQAGLAYGFSFDKSGLVFSVRDQGGMFLSAKAKGYHNDGAWHFAAATYDGATLTLYLDGAPVKSVKKNLFGKPSTNQVRFTVGASRGGRSYYKGDLRNMSLHSVARSASQIKKEFKQGFTGPDQSCTGYWHMDTGQGKTVYDVAGGFAEGTLKGKAAWRFEPVPAGKKPRTAAGLGANYFHERLYKVMFLNIFARQFYNSVLDTYSGDISVNFSSADMNPANSPGAFAFGQKTWPFPDIDRLHFLLTVQYLLYCGAPNFATAGWLASMNLGSPIDIFAYEDNESMQPIAQGTPLEAGAERMYKSYIDLGFTTEGVALASVNRLIPVRYDWSNQNAFLKTYSAAFPGATPQARQAAALRGYRRGNLLRFLAQNTVDRLRTDNLDSTTEALFSAASDKRANAQLNLFGWQGVNRALLIPMLADLQTLLRLEMNVDAAADLVSDAEWRGILAGSPSDFLAAQAANFPGATEKERSKKATTAFVFLCFELFLQENSQPGKHWEFLLNPKLPFMGGLNTYKWPAIGIDKPSAYEILLQAQNFANSLRTVNMIDYRFCLYYAAAGRSSVIEAFDAILDGTAYRRFPYWFYHDQASQPDKDVIRVNRDLQYIFYNNANTDFKTFSFIRPGALKTLRLPPGKLPPADNINAWQRQYIWGATGVGACFTVTWYDAKTATPLYFEGDTLADKKANQTAFVEKIARFTMLTALFNALKGVPYYNFVTADAPLSQQFANNAALSMQVLYNIYYKGKRIGPKVLKSLYPLLDEWHELLNAGMPADGASFFIASGHSVSRLSVGTYDEFVTNFYHFFAGKTVAAQKASARAVVRKLLAKNSEGRVESLTARTSSLIAQKIARAHADAAAQKEAAARAARQTVLDAGNKARQRLLNHGVERFYNINQGRLVILTPKKGSADQLTSSGKSFNFFTPLPESTRTVTVKLPSNNTGQQIPGLPVRAYYGFGSGRAQNIVNFDTTDTNYGYLILKGKVTSDTIKGYQQPTMNNYGNVAQLKTSNYLMLYGGGRETQLKLTGTTASGNTKTATFEIVIYPPYQYLYQPAAGIADIAVNPQNPDQIYWCSNNSGTAFIYYADMAANEVGLLYTIKKATVPSIAFDYNSKQVFWTEFSGRLGLFNWTAKGKLMQGDTVHTAPKKLTAHSSLLPMSRLNYDTATGSFRWNSAVINTNTGIARRQGWTYKPGGKPKKQIEKKGPVGTANVVGQNAFMFFSEHNQRYYWTECATKNVPNVLKSCNASGQDEQTLMESKTVLFPMGAREEFGELYIGSKPTNIGWTIQRVQADGAFPVELAVGDYPVLCLSKFAAAEAALVEANLKLARNRMEARRNIAAAHGTANQKIATARQNMEAERTQWDNTRAADFKKYAGQRAAAEKQLNAATNKHDSAVSAARKKAVNQWNSTESNTRKKIKSNKQNLNAQTAKARKGYRADQAKAAGIDKQKEAQQAVLNRKNEEVQSKRLKLHSKARQLKNTLQVIQNQS